MSVWDYHDNQMKKLKKIYVASSSKMISVYFPNILDKTHFTLNPKAIVSNKEVLQSYINRWIENGTYYDDLRTKATVLLARPTVSLIDMISVILLGEIYLEKTKIEEEQTRIIKDDANHYYYEGQEEVEKNGITFAIPTQVFLAILLSANCVGHTLEDYKRYDADRRAAEIVQYLERMGIDVDLTSKSFKQLIDKQDDRTLKIEGDDVTGDMDNFIIGFCNSAKEEGILLKDEDAKVTFMAIEDERTTPMCNSLDGQVFSIRGRNTFTRMYGEDIKTISLQTFNVEGLQTGLNLPPISHYYHQCRSTITYLGK